MGVTTAVYTKVKKIVEGVYFWSAFTAISGDASGGDIVSPLYPSDLFKERIVSLDFINQTDNTAAGMKIQAYITPKAFPDEISAVTSTGFPIYCQTLVAGPYSNSPALPLISKRIILGRFAPASVLLTSLMTANWATNTDTKSYWWGANGFLFDDWKYVLLK